VKYTIPDPFEEKIADLLTDDEYSVTLRWKEESLKLGALRPQEQLFRIDFSNPKFTENAENPYRLFSRPFCRAGWLLPTVDPTAWGEILSLRQTNDLRLEFIFDTCALDQGIAHFLISLFADRCDCVVTDVTLRELQDKHGEARFGKELETKNRGKCIAARQLYLAASRLREFSGFRKPLWRELHLDDTALLLSRGGKSGDKSSESDTALLRAVRRSMESHVRGLHRVFVTGDTALGRRATIELPRDRTWVAYIPSLKESQVLAPLKWWPGPDEGYGITTPTVPKLLWELLACCDSLELKSGDSTIELSAFQNPMWPVDYLKPWVRVSHPGNRTSKNAQSSKAATEPSPTQAVGARPLKGADSVKKSGLDKLLFPAPSDYLLDQNLRPSWENTFTILSAIASSSEPVPIPAFYNKLSSASQYPLRALLEGLDLAKFDPDSNMISPGLRSEILREYWKAESIDGVISLLLGYLPLREVALPGSEHAGRPKATTSGALAMGRVLGLVFDGKNGVQPVGANPSGQEVQSAIRKELERRERKAMSILELLTELLPNEVGMGPVRAVRAWDRMEELGVFEPFEMRMGGTSSGDHRTKSVVISQDGTFMLKEIDYETVNGYRDISLVGR